MKHQVLSLKPTGNVANHVAATKNLPNSHAAVISKKTLNSTGCLVESIHLKIAEKNQQSGDDSLYSWFQWHPRSLWSSMVTIFTLWSTYKKTMENHHLYSIKMHPQKKQRQD